MRRKDAWSHCVTLMRAVRFPISRFPDFPISRFPDFPISDVRTGLRHCLVLATADPTLAALRPVHDHARIEHARHARCTRASLASDARALTLQHALARQHARMSACVTGHWLTVGRPAACASGVHTNCKCSRRARRADVHARCFGLISPDVLHVDVATVRRHETTNEMTTSEMTTNETSKTSEKKYQTSGCACGPKNCETKRPSAQARDPKSSKRTQTRQELCHLLRYTDEMRETSKASETKHEASRCARKPHELRAPRTANPRDQETESRTKNPSTTGRSCAHPFLQEPGVADLGAR